tara:strand:+ start:1353 stop:1988 length:636 start_codon:yes stop_codon:yes gene_type:complete
MIDFRNKFIFIHVHKAAGKSISRALERNHFSNIINKSDYLYYHYKKHFGKKYIVSEIDNIKKHSQAIDYKTYLKDDYAKYFKFAFVRNPFDWQVSQYFYMKEKKVHFQHEIVKNMNFRDYIVWRCQEDLQLQTDYLLDSNNNVIVDFIGKVENIQYDIKKVEQNIGFKLNLPHINKSEHSRSTEYYDDFTLNLVVENFKKDFKLLKYKTEL